MAKAMKASPMRTRGVMKKKKAYRQSPKALIKKSSLRSALVANLKAQSGRKDIRFNAAPKIADKTQRSVAIEQRAGYPVKLPKGAVDPKNWKTVNGVKVDIDFSRASWLPDTWGQGVKITKKLSAKGMKARQKNGHSFANKGGGILTTFVAPDGKCFFHKHMSEAHFLKVEGRPMTAKDGIEGKVRLAKLQAQQQMQLARAQIKDLGNGGKAEMIGIDKDETFFKILSPSERKCIPKTAELHFAVVSARRAKDPEGVRDIFMVQTQMVEGGVTPIWYVDKDSLQDYQALGLKAVVGGKLTEARNKALQDARKLRKVCIQVSDDISAWEYRDGKQPKERSDDANNAAHAAARRYIISPVAAAKFITAKMRSATVPKPKLGGVYMLGSCARAFSADPFVRNHFILGDFFVVDMPSKVNFDPQMKLKEDYDFTCAHIKAHGSVMRCNRMTLNVKHYDNGGGACTNRDKKGVEEKRNVDILNKKWPGVFRANPKRKNEVIMRWKKSKMQVGDSDSDDDTDAVLAKKVATKATRKGILKKMRKQR
jgi:hypothetical protein